MTKQEQIQIILEDFNRNRNIPGIKICTKKNIHPEDEKWKSRSHHIKEWNCQCLSIILRQILRRRAIWRYWVGIRQTWDWKQHRRSRHRYERDERNSWYDDWRVARCNQQTQKKVNQQTTMESDPKTSKHATKKRKRWWDRSSTRYKKRKAFTSWHLWSIAWYVHLNFAWSSVWIWYSPGVKSAIHSHRKQFEQCKQIADRVIVSNIVSVTFFLCITFINLQMALKGDFPRLQNRGMGICLGDNDFKRNSFTKCCATSSTTQKKWDSKYLQENENSQKPKPEQ